MSIAFLAEFGTSPANEFHPKEMQKNKKKAILITMKKIAVIPSTLNFSKHINMRFSYANYSYQC